MQLLLRLPLSLASLNRTRLIWPKHKMLPLRRLLMLRLLSKLKMMRLLRHKPKPLHRLLLLPRPKTRVHLLKPVLPGAWLKLVAGLRQRKKPPELT